MHPAEDQIDLEPIDRSGLSWLSSECVEARKEALSPVSRFLSDIVRAIHLANPSRSLPPLAVEMRREFGLDRLPSDEVGLGLLLTQIQLFVSSRGLLMPRHLSGLLREAIAAANGPLISVDLTYQRS